MKGLTTSAVVEIETKRNEQSSSIENGTNYIFSFVFTKKLVGQRLCNKTPAFKKRSANKTIFLGEDVATLVNSCISLPRCGKAGKLQFDVDLKGFK
jgi:hypothetical protein